MIAAWAGEKDLACEQLAIVIRKPGDLSYGQLKLMPFWDSLRGDPRFEKIVASLGPKDQETIKTAGVSQNALQVAAATSRSIRRSSTPDRRSASRDRAGAQQR
jgi:hypothetical protein